MTIMAYDPILFDLDGTLIDSAGDIAAAVNRTLQGMHLPRLPPKEIEGFVGDGVRRLMQRTLAGREEALIETAIQSFKQDYRARCLVTTQPYPGIRAMLGHLAGARLAVVTNKPVDFARQILDGLDLGRYFGAVVGGDEAPLKPEPAPLLLALERLGATADRAIMIGDHDNDIHAGRAAGMETCGVTWGFDGGARVRACAPTHRLDSVAALDALLTN